MGPWYPPRTCRGASSQGVVSCQISSSPPPGVNDRFGVARRVRRARLHPAYRVKAGAYLTSAQITKP